MRFRFGEETVVCRKEDGDSGSVNSQKRKQKKKKRVNKDHPSVARNDCVFPNEKK
jgi:hypothetical protein